MKTCNNCTKTSPDDATFCIECGKVMPKANTGATTRLKKDVEVDGKNAEKFYFIYRNDLPVLLDGLSYTEIQNTIYALSNNEDIYYHGRKVVFID